MGFICTLLHDKVSRARIVEAVEIEGATGVRHELRLCATPSELMTVLRRTPSVTVVLDPFLAGRLQLPLVAWCVRHTVAHGLMLYGDFRGRPAQESVELVELGVRWLATRGVDDSPLALRRLLIRASGDLVARDFLLQAKRLVGPSAHEILEFAFQLCLSPTGVTELAAKWHLSTRQLHRRFRSLGLPPPGVLIRWFRVLHAARLMDDEARSLNQTSALLGFSDPANLRRLMRRVTGLTPSQVRRRGGLVALQVALLSRLSPMQVTVEPRVELPTSQRDPRMSQSDI